MVNTTSLPTILIINSWKMSADAELQSYIGPFQKYIDNYVRPAWGFAAKIDFVPYAQHTHASRRAWWMAIRNRSDVSGALGYHDVHPNGLPFGRVFAGDDERYGASLPVTITHEIDEMLGDPDTNQEVRIGTRGYFKELCDAVEADGQAIMVDGVACSNFVLPPYFVPGSKGPWDYGHHLRGPIPDLTSGGYLAYEENGQIHQVTARLSSGHMSYRSMRHGRMARRAKRPGASG
jgi:hypothetical protein